MKYIILILSILLPINALCCTPSQTPDAKELDAQIIGKVLKITSIPSAKARLSMATVLVLEKSRGTNEPGKEYNFVVAGSIGCGSSCKACLGEGFTYEMTFNYTPAEKKIPEFGAYEATLLFHRVKLHEPIQQ